MGSDRQEWVEAQARTVEAAVKAAMQALGVSDQGEVDIEVIQEPKAGFLGLGAQDAVVKVAKKAAPAKKRRRRRGGRGKGAEAGAGDEGARAGAGKGRGGDGRNRERSKNDDRRGGSSGSRKPQSGRSQSKTRAAAPSKAGQTATKERNSMEDKPQVSIEEQAKVAKEFLEGLLDAYGLEGTVTTRIEDDVLYLDVAGDQTEALVGPKGSVLQSVLEVTRTVVQRKTYGAPRMRLDINGYTERRREALRIYTRKLADRILETGREVMLEPMNAADRKVVHDAAAEIEGIVSYSEGEEPNRAVVLGLAEGFTPRGAEADEDSPGSSEEE